MKKKDFDINGLKKNLKGCFICENKIDKSDIVYEDEDVIAFLDSFPPTKAYTLVSLKKHYDDISEVPTELYVKFSNTVLKISKAIKIAYNPKRICLLNTGGIVTHFHFHIIPMYEEVYNNLIDVILKKEVLTLTANNKISIAKKIKNNLN